MEDPILLAKFQEKIDKGLKIEPKDWMPEAYRKQLNSYDESACTFRNCRHVT
jgi:hypothetical protein